MNYIRQLIYDMRHQKMMTIVSICGTAVSIFLVLVFYMVDSLSTVEVAPETKRHLIHQANQLAIEFTSGELKGNINNSQFSYAAAKRLFDNLEGVDEVSFFTHPNSKSVMGEDGIPIPAGMLHVDENYWKIYDFTFLVGRPFTENEILNNVHLPIVLSESFARKIFGSIDVLDREVNVNGTSYYVIGVTEDTSPILSQTYSEARLPLYESIRGSNSNYPEFAYNGYLSILLLFKEGTDQNSVKKQVDARVATLNSELAEYNVEAKVLEIESPEEMAMSGSWIWDKNINSVVSRKYLVFALLLLLPAINLSSMMRGRIQNRISEIGVRRAFGAKKRNIILQLLGENFLVTLVGGLIGLLLSYIFMLFLSSSFMSLSMVRWASSLEVRFATPSFDMLFTWKAFALALCGCLVLNILTASLPAWRASSMPPASAIVKSRN